MVRRISRTEIALGIVDKPISARPVNPFTGAGTAQRIAEQTMALLRNSNRCLPLSASRLKSIAVIGSHADVGVLSGAGADQVDAAGSEVAIVFVNQLNAEGRDVPTLWLALTIRTSWSAAWPPPIRAPLWSSRQEAR
jgi:beta-glucosidase-like glycosyl hydrolase